MENWLVITFLTNSLCDEKKCEKKYIGLNNTHSPRQRNVTPKKNID